MKGGNQTNNPDDKPDKDRSRAKPNYAQGKESGYPPKSRKPSGDDRISILDDKIRAKTKVVPVDTKQSGNNVPATATSNRLEDSIRPRLGAEDNKSPNTSTNGVVATRAPYQGKQSGRSASESENLRTQVMLSQMTGEKIAYSQPTDENVEVEGGQSELSQPDEDVSLEATLNDSLPATMDIERDNNIQIDSTGRVVRAERDDRDYPAEDVMPDEISIDEPPSNIEAFAVPPVYVATDVVPIKSDQEIEAEFIKKVMLVACILAVVAAGIAVPVSLATGGKEVPFTDEPTTRPTNVPSSMPSIVPTTDKYEQTIKMLTNVSLSDAAALFHEQNVSTREQLLDKNSPQGKALHWVSNEDPMSLEINNSKYLQRYIMAVFYFSMDGPNWFRCSQGSICSRKASWLSGEDECNWHEGDCVGGKVSQINLATSTGNGLKGEFPKEICYFTEMNIIAVHNNNIRGTIPACFGGFSKLRLLILKNNQIELPIHEEAVDGWDSLQLLFLGGNKLDGPFPESLLRLPSLKELELQDNDLTGTFPEFDASVTPFLVALDLSRNKLQGDVPLSLYDIPRLNISNQKS